MKSLILILLWASPIFFFTLYARDSGAQDALQMVNFENVNSKLCIGVDHASTSSGAYIKQFTCNLGEDNQWWLLYPLQAGRPLQAGSIFSLKNKKSGMCMGVDRASTNPNADIRQFPCDSSLNQRWFYLFDVPTCLGQSELGPSQCITNVRSNLCVGVNQASKANGAQLKQFICDNRPNQLWFPTKGAPEP